MISKRLALAVCGLTLAIAAPAATQVPPHGDKIVETRHSIALPGGKKLAYTARAGLLPLYVNDTGERMGTVFFISYTADRAADAPRRPITFLWNGGPGSNSAQVHVVGFGPKRVTTADTFPQWSDNTETPLVDHAETWLTDSDLVFIDPPGTGFSRATNLAFRDTLYSTRGDAEATAEAVRLYLTRFDRWNDPLYIAGESYGATRAMWVAEALEKRRTHLNGVVLISGGYEAGQKLPAHVNQAMGVTLFTAAGHFHKRLAPELQTLTSDEAVRRATAWARDTYAPALARRDALSATERQAILADLKRYTGLDPQYVDAKTLVIDKDVYGDKLLADKGLELGRYDMRMALPYRGANVFWMPWDDPSLLPMRDLMEGTSRVFNTYVRKDLGFESDLLYRGPFGKAFHPEPLEVDPQAGYGSDWMALMFKMAPRSNAPPPLQRAMEMNPKLEVMNMRGLYDISCAQMDAAVEASPPTIRPRVTNHCEIGGHMFYSDKEARRTGQREFADFVRKTTR